MFPPHPLFMAAPLSTFPATSHSPHHRHTSHVDRRRCRAAANMDATIRTDSHAKIHTTRMHGTNVPGGNCVSMGTPSHTSIRLRNLLLHPLCVDVEQGAHTASVHSFTPSSHMTTNNHINQSPVGLQLSYALHSWDGSRTCTPCQPSLPLQGGWGCAVQNLALQTATNTHAPLHVKHCRQNSPTRTLPRQGALVSQEDSPTDSL